MLSGPLGGSLFSRRPLTFTQIWTSISILPSDEEAEKFFSANYSQEPATPAEAHSPCSSSVPPDDA